MFYFNEVYCLNLYLVSSRQNTDMSHDMTKPTKCLCAQRTQISLGICPIWSASSLSARRKLGSLATHWAQSEDSDQTGRMPRLIWVFAGCTVTVGFVMSQLICAMKLQASWNSLGKFKSPTLFKSNSVTHTSNKTLLIWLLKSNLTERSNHINTYVPPPPINWHLSVPRVLLRT